MLRRLTVGITLILMGLTLIAHVPFSAAQADPEPLVSIETPDGVTSVRWSSDGQTILADGYQRGVWAWDAETGQASLSFELDSAYIIEWNESGSLFLTQTFDENLGEALTIWEGMMPIFVYNSPHEHDWSPNGDYILGIGRIPGGLTTQLWDIQNRGGMLQEWIGFEHGVATNRYAIAYDHANLAVYDYQESKLLFDRCYDGIVQWADWASSENVILAHIGNSLTAIDLDGNVLRTTEIDPYVEELTTSPDGSFVSLYSRLGGNLAVIETTTGEVSLKLDGNFSLTKWKPDGSALAYLDQSDSTLRIWDATTRKIRAIDTGELPVDYATWANQSESILLYSNNLILYYDLTTDQNLLLNSESRKFVLSPDDQRLLLWDENTIQIWNTADILATAQTPPASLDQVAVGEQYYHMIGCTVCHSPGENALDLPLEGIYGQERVREDGSIFTVDEAYLRESITDPNAYLAGGFPAGIQPAYELMQLTSYQIDAIVAYMVSLSEP